MGISWKSGLCVALGSVAGAFLALWLSRGSQPVIYAADGDKTLVLGPRVSVVSTEGHNLIAVDNVSSTLYFYTVDRDQPVGSELKLRGHLDLKDLGKPVLKPVVASRARDGFGRKVDEKAGEAK